MITFADIIKGCIKRERHAQHALYKSYYSYGMSIAIRYVENESEAISIYNDSLMKVFDKISSFKNDKEFKPWLRRILINTALDHLKSNSKYKMEIDINTQYNLSSSEDVLSSFRYEDLIAMVKQLSQAYRTVFNMYVIDGFKHEEIAQKLNISIGTSKSNLSKARKALQVMIYEQKTVNHA